MDYSMTKKEFKNAVTSKLSHLYGVTPNTADEMQIYKAVATVVKEKLAEGSHEFIERTKKDK